VLDGAGHPVPDALVEIWQADSQGNIVHRSGSVLRDGTFTGWGRAETDREGGYWFRTLVPGPTEPGRAPFFAMTVFARGLQDRLFTRAYVPHEAGPRSSGPSPSETDPLLASLEPERRSTLLAVQLPDGSLRFDLRLQQGPQGGTETVFLTYDTAPEAGRDGVDA
jgi:protocatechuate 3,4-dioxygenase alpha subunit